MGSPPSDGDAGKGHPLELSPTLLSEKSDAGSRRQKQPVVRQHFLNRLREPHGQRSFLPSFSSSSLSPCTTLTPRLTCFSEGNPRRRLLIVSKKHLIMNVICKHAAPPVRHGRKANRTPPPMSTTSLTPSVDTSSCEQVRKGFCNCRAAQQRK